MFESKITRIREGCLCVFESKITRIARISKQVFSRVDGCVVSTLTSSQMRLLYILRQKIVHIIIVSFILHHTPTAILFHNFPFFSHLFFNLPPRQQISAFLFPKFSKFTWLPVFVIACFLFVCLFGVSDYSVCDYYLYANILHRNFLRFTHPPPQSPANIHLWPPGASRVSLIKAKMPCSRHRRRSGGGGGICF